MQIGLSEKGREAVAKGLEIFLANTYTTYLKTQNAHWNYVGEDFYALHLLFEQQYEEMAEAVDEIAERIRSLGFFAPASFLTFQKNSTLDSQEDPEPSEMIEDLITSHEGLICHGRKLCDLAEHEKDAGSVDLLGRRLGVHEKFIWMLKNYL